MVKRALLSVVDNWQEETFSAIRETFGLEKIDTLWRVRLHDKVSNKKLGKLKVKSILLDTN